MSNDVITIKQVPADLKAFWADRAKENDRSMNKEILRLLEEERQRLLRSPPPRNDELIDRIVRGMQKLPIIDDRPMDDILYDEEGMPK